MFNLKEFKKENEYGLSLESLKELVKNAPQTRLRMKYRGILKGIEGDHRPIVLAKDALNFAIELQNTDYKYGYIREIWIIE